MLNGCRRSEIEQDLSDPVPLFLYLTCCFKYKDFCSNFAVRDVPTCLGNYFLCSASSRKKVAYDKLF